MPTLSICIPTYNRAKYLAELLDSICDQHHPEVEIVVSDDASPDETAEVVATYKEKIPGLIFIKQPNNIGLDRNFLVVVEAASNDYVWLIGDDDRLEPNAVDRVLKALTDWPGVAGLTLGVIDYNHQFSEATGIRAMPPTGTLHGAEAVFRELVELLGFMSAVVVDRHAWAKVCREEPIDEYLNYYIHVYIIGKIIGHSREWGIVQTPCVGFRTSNDQFLSKFGWLKRLKMDVFAYEQLANGLFKGNVSALNALQRKVFYTHVLARVRNAKTSAGRTPEIIGASRFLYSHYGNLPAYWYIILPTLFTPKSILRAAREYYKLNSNSSGAKRAKQLTN